MAYKVFTNGSVLNASEINDNLMNQSIIVFSNAAARTSAITSPIEGMITYLEDTAAYESYDGAAWISFGGGGGKILQVIQTVKSDTFTLSSTTYTEITGLTATITPSSATSKILVNFSIQGSSDAGLVSHMYRIMRGVTAIGIGDAAGSRTQATTLRTALTNASLGASVTSQFLDSPASTSAITYSIQVRGETANLLTINRSAQDVDNAQYSRSISTITLMEVAV